MQENKEPALITSNQLPLKKSKSIKEAVNDLQRDIVAFGDITSLYTDERASTDNNRMIPVVTPQKAQRSITQKYIDDNN